ncbi:MAG: copper oxidase, partial [Comamonadaceae bacterium]
MPHGIRRRSLLQGLSGAAGVSLLGGAVAQDGPRRLPIPPLLDARAQGGRIELAAQPGETEFWPGARSATAGYNGGYLGPTLRVHSGDEVRVRVTNRLQEDTTVHWHGLLVPSAVDGGPHNTIAPGARWEPVVPVRQAATTAWYHAHPHMRTGPQVYAGLAGMLIVTDAQEEGLRLPSRYGIDDLPLVLQDKAFDRDRRDRVVRTAIHGRRHQQPVPVHGGVF